MSGQSKNYLKRKYYLLPLAIFVSFVQCHATTAIFVVTKNGIVAGADQLTYSVTFGGVRTDEGTGSKIALVKDHFVVATIGVENIKTPTTTSYDFTDFVRTIESKLTGDVSVSQLASVIENESAKTFNAIGFENLMRTGTIKRSESIHYWLVQYIVAGYDASVPAVIEIKYDLDWNGYHLVGPIRQTTHPKEGHDADFGFYAFGTTCSIEDVSKPGSYAYKRALAYTPVASKKLLARQPLSMVEGSDLVRVLISTQAEINPSSVGPTATIITLPVDGAGRLTSYQNTPTLPVRTTRKKKEPEKTHQDAATQD